MYRGCIVPLLDNVLNGYNATVFAYGMTGAGKTYTMFGDMKNTSIIDCEPGIALLSVKDLFNKF